MKKITFAFLLLGLVACTKEEIPTPTKPIDPLPEYSSYTVVKAGPQVDAPFNGGYYTYEQEIKFHEIGVDKQSNWDTAQNGFVVKDSGIYFVQIYGVKVDWKTKWGDYYDEVSLKIWCPGKTNPTVDYEFRGLLELNLQDSAKDAKVYSTPSLDNDLFTLPNLGHMRKGDVIKFSFAPVHSRVGYKLKELRVLIYKKK